MLLKPVWCDEIYAVLSLRNKAKQSANPKLSLQGSLMKQLERED